MSTYFLYVLSVAEYCVFWCIEFIIGFHVWLSMCLFKTLGWTLGQNGTPLHRAEITTDLQPSPFVSPVFLNTGLNFKFEGIFFLFFGRGGEGEGDSWWHQIYGWSMNRSSYSTKYSLFSENRKKNVTINEN